MTTWYLRRKKKKKEAKLYNVDFQALYSGENSSSFETMKKKRRDAEQQQNIQDNYERLYSHSQGMKYKTCSWNHPFFYFKFHLEESPEAM